MESTLIEIIKYFEKYKSTITNIETEDNVTSFTLYLTAQLALKGESNRSFEKEQWKTVNRHTLIEMAAAYMGKMGRYVDQYARKSMLGTPIENLDEFTYLILLLQLDSISKSDIIQRNVHPITTGTEILKRLLKKGFIEQFPDTTDKRKMRVALSEKGKIALYQSAKTTQKLALIAVGILSTEALMDFVSSLKKLDQFHHHIHHKHKNLNLDVIIADERELK